MIRPPCDCPNGIFTPLSEQERREFGGFSAPTPGIGTKRWRYELTKAVSSAPRFSVSPPDGATPFKYEQIESIGWNDSRRRMMEARLLIETLATHKQLVLDV
jgi:hypothetical protein